MHTAHLLTVSQYALPEGCLPGGCLPRGCLPGGCLPGGCLLGGVCPGSVCLGLPLVQGCVADTPWTDRHLWKHNLHKRCLQSVNIQKYKCPSVCPIVCDTLLWFAIRDNTEHNVTNKANKGRSRASLLKRCPFNDSLFTDYCLFPDCLVSKMYSACIIDQYVTSTNASFTDSPSHPSFGFQFWRHNLTPDLS